MDGTATPSFQGDIENPTVLPESNDHSSSSYGTSSPVPVPTTPDSSLSTGTVITPAPHLIFH